jgi:glyoxylase-like metal-dependent hydrolase (beta-lactamase superfamily II)
MLHPWNLKVIAAVLALCTACLAAGQTSTQPAVPAHPRVEYEVYAIRFATLVGYPVSQLVAGADSARRMDLAMMFWLVRGNGRNILVDSGFYRDKFFHDDRFHLTDFVKPSDVLVRVGLKPEDITDIVITHMHWDHADGMDLFPNARIWIQKDEYTYYSGEAWASKDTHLGIDRDDVLALVNLDLAGRVSLVAGDNQEIIPGVTCYTGGRHTYASQYVAIHTAKGVVVLASDNVYVKENLSKHVPIAATLDAQSNLRAQDRMKGIASNVRFIISGHDPAVFSDFPAVGDGVIKIE